MVKRSTPAPAVDAATPAPAHAAAAAQIYGPGSFSRENSVGYLMRRIVQLMVNEVDHRLADGGLTHAQWTPLFLIHRGQANTLAALARDLQVDAGALTRTLDRLEAKGLCRRERSVDDRRVVHQALREDPHIETQSVEVEGTDKKAMLLRPKRKE